MTILERPYAGTWRPNVRPTIQYSPDALVYINGDSSLPGCRTCHHDIDIQQFVTSISTDCGVEPGASTATIAMSIPKFYGDSIFRDGNSLLKVALEVHIYARGYFPMTGLATPGAKAGDVTLSDIPQYPYYPIFHGVVTTVNDSYSGGYYSVSLTCSGMLHFWSHMKISNNGSFFGARPQNSRVQTTITGHPYSGRTPYAIIYDLYRDTTGAAAGVGFALQSRTNFNATSSTTRDSMFSLAMRYWERRFRDRMYGLRMHGASGQMFTTAQQAYLSQYRTSSQAGQFISANLSQQPAGRDVFALDRGLLLGLADRQDGRVLRQPDLSLLPSASGGRYGLDVTQMQAFVRDIGTYGQVNLFESTYESKLDVATQVTQVTGFEFYQDVDGDLVFKPPLYNLDTSSSRIYRIEPIDIISMDKNEAEPDATYIIIKAGPFQNTRGLVDEAEWGIRSVYVDYKLVAQFGWREQSIETQYYNNARSAYYAGVSQLDRLNVGMNSASITIPMRPEIRPGYPIYVPHLDCYYYVQSLSHSLSFGSGQPTTTLNLVARRRKFFPPGMPSVSAGRNGVNSVDLANTALPPKPLQALSTEGLPRLIGFPNVVMALDPTRINPQFFVYGFQAEDSALSTGNAQTRTRNRALFLDNFVQILVSNGLLALSQRSAVSANPMEGPWSIQRDGFADITLTKEQLTSALGNYITLRSRSRDAITAIQRRDTALEREATTLQNDTSRTESQERRLTQEIPRERARLAQELHDLRANFATQREGQQSIVEIRTGVRNTVEATRDARLPGRRNLSETDQEQIAIFTFLINQARPQTPGPGFQDTSRDPTGTVNESANILDLLNDRKGSMGVNIPGYYRYYSAAHPDPTQQGYELLTTEIDPDAAEEGTGSGTGSSPESSGGTSAFVDGDDPILSGSTRPVGGWTPVTGSRLIPGAVGDDPNARPPRDAPRLESNVEGIHTPMRGPQVAAYLREAWRNVHNGQPPTNEVLAVLTAQWAHENGRRGRGMYNFNFGGIKAQGHANDTGWHGASTRLLTREDHNPTLVFRNFRAYGSARQGAQDYLGVLMRVHGEAIARVVASNDPRQYVQALHRSGYMTGSDPGGYIRSVTSLTRTALEEWIPASTSINTQDAQLTQNTPINPPVVGARRGPTPATRRRTPGGRGSRGGTQVGTNTPTNAPTTGAAPSRRIAFRREELESVLVVNANAVEGMPEDRQADLVSLSVGVPTNGLRVRTSLSRDPIVVPTSQIFTLTFEERGVPRASTVPTVTYEAGTTLDSVRQLFDSCLSSPPLAEALASSFVARVGQSAMGNIGQTAGDLVGQAVLGINNLRAGDGNQIPQTANIANGVPNNRATLRGQVVTDQRVGSVDNARVILREKASSLLTEVTIYNQPALDRAIESSSTEPMQFWTQSITALFGNVNLPPGLPFHTQTVGNPVRETLGAFSPVFPVSDARGYEHFGSFQYGRGLSIEPGGNYERLMSNDPFRYVDPAQVDAFVRQLRSSPIGRDAQGNISFPANLRSSMEEIAGNASFQASVGGQIALRWAENQGSTGDRTTMIATGLANYIMSDRDSVTKLPVSNAAFNLTDLQPATRRETCECRGAEADLLLAAYMVGVDRTFIGVDAPNSASQWVTDQRVRASESWAVTQQAMRGVSTSSGRQSLLDRVAGWQQLTGQVGASASSAGRSAETQLDENVRRLNDAADQVTR